MSLALILLLFPQVYLILNAVARVEPIGSMQDLANRQYGTFPDAEAAIHDLAVQQGFSAVVRHCHGQRMLEIGNQYIRTDF